MEVIASAPAKVILFGEHFVVYGKPAIVMAINKRAYIKAKPRTDRKIYINSLNLKSAGFFENGKFTPKIGGLEAKARLEPIKAVIEKIFQLCEKKCGLEIEINSEIPVAAGLGSSAAVAAATAMAVSALLDVRIERSEIFEIAYEAERLVHGTPSGIDPAIATYGGTIIFQKDMDIQSLSVSCEIPLVIGNTGLERSTGELVAKVRMNKEKYPSIINPIIEIGGEIAERAKKALERGEIEVLGELMNINHSLLSAVGVSHEFLDRLVGAARQAGALGAKLTGAGGGGCMIALARHQMLEKVALAIRKAGGAAFIAEKSNEGVRIEAKN